MYDGITVYDGTQSDCFIVLLCFSNNIIVYFYFFFFFEKCRNFAYVRYALHCKKKNYRTLLFSFRVADWQPLWDRGFDLVYLFCERLSVCVSVLLSFWL